MVIGSRKREIRGLFADSPTGFWLFSCYGGGVYRTAYYSALNRSRMCYPVEDDYGNHKQEYRSKNDP